MIKKGRSIQWGDPFHLTNKNFASTYAKRGYKYFLRALKKYLLIYSGLRHRSKILDSLYSSTSNVVYICSVQTPNMCPNFLITRAHHSR